MAQKRLVLLLIAVCLAATSLVATAQTSPHNPYTIPGVQLRANMVVPVPDGMGGYRPVSMGAAAFQEIAPCRLVSTLSGDAFPAPFGGPAFGANESRVYVGVGQLTSGGWVNPCSDKIPLSALALATRLTVIDPQGNGTIYLTQGIDPV
ncbi:MAG TPA: hypothetical protein VHU41_09380, partial [Thermoanaerobaculia bacterium]|nr:hypothetical protein [Thermoanaerobaculia bacterium]